MAHLEVLEGFHCGERFALPDDAGVGRHPESFLCLPEHHVSRHHARLRRRGKTFVIEDLQSSNGIIVQGQRLLPQVPYELQDGDEITICSTRSDGFMNCSRGVARILPLNRPRNDVGTAASFCF